MLQLLPVLIQLWGVFNPYAGQHYLQIYGVPGTVNTPIYPYGQLGQTLPGGHSYTTVHGYAMPGHHIVQFGGPSVNAVTSSPIPSIQAPYPTGEYSIQAPYPTCKCSVERSTKQEGCNVLAYLSFP